MAAAVAELTDTPSAARRPARRRRTLPVAAALALACAAAAVFVLSGSHEQAGDAAPQEGAIVDVAQMTANLAGPQVHYVRFGFAAVLAADVAAADVEGRFALLKDAALSEIATFSADHLRTPAGVEELRGRLTARAAGVYPDGQVLRIVLTELVVQ
ncbi:MAG TPA: flagellar basal body-associated FliL family protein [Egibacteraceae bacterium]|nr:flagellar basal body-associated FliL family protein [Egibacteraceae bacterium]